MKEYNDDDLAYALQILHEREQLDDAVVEEWLKDERHAALLRVLARVRQEGKERDFSTWKEEVWRRLRLSVRRGRVRGMWRWAAAAAVVVAVGAGMWLWQQEGKPGEKALPMAVNEITGTGVELILQSGERVALGGSSQRGGQWTDSLQQLSYERMEAGDSAGAENFNTLRVPVGGWYEVTLADGTHVWLNAATELRFPVSFGGEERRVYLSGEAYFDVEHDEAHPFVVVTGGVDVRVLGTAFNVNAYEGEEVQTTLVEGCVGMEVRASGKTCRLRPGQMGETVAGGIRVREVDPYVYTAWKDGKFVFDGETVVSIMDRLARWYGLEVFYENEAVKGQLFFGVITRFADVREVLRMIEKTGSVHFDVKDNVVIVK